MKKRYGFVSNSSSSSFVVVSNSDNYISDKNTGDTYIVGKNGETDFGWQEERYYDFDSKVNWVYLQALYAMNRGKPEYMIKFNDVMSKYCEDYLISLIPYFYNTDTLNQEINTIKDTAERCGVDISERFESPTIDIEFVSGYIDHQSVCGETNTADAFNDLEAFLFCENSYIQNDNDNH